MCRGEYIKYIDLVYASRLLSRWLRWAGGELGQATGASRLNQKTVSNVMGEK